MHKRGQAELKTKAKQNPNKTAKTGWAAMSFSQQQNIKQTKNTYIIMNKEGTAENNCVSDLSKGRCLEREATGYKWECMAMRMTVGRGFLPK